MLDIHSSMHCAIQFGEPLLGSRINQDVLVYAPLDADYNRLHQWIEESVRSRLSSPELKIRVVYGLIPEYPAD